MTTKYIVIGYLYGKKVKLSIPLVLSLAEAFKGNLSHQIRDTDLEPFYEEEDQESLLSQFKRLIKRGLNKNHRLIFENITRSDLATRKLNDELGELLGKLWTKK
jgi:Txe/YoeB family toxin of Txe-Axe toxin-antitoxin module